MPRTAAPVAGKATPVSKEDAIAALSAELMGSQQEKIELPDIDINELFTKQTAVKSTGNFTLAFGLVSMKVKTYKAVDDDNVAFNQIHARKPLLDKEGNQVMKDNVPQFETACMTNLRQPAMVCGCCGLAVTGEQAGRGYKKADGTFIEVTDAELNQCRAAASEMMTVTEFVALSDVDPVYFQTSYYLAPDKGTAEKPFALLRAAMIAKGKVAVCAMVKKGREKTVILRPFGHNGIMLHEMVYEYEVRDFDGWKNVPTELNPKELEIAGKLVDMLSTDFAPETKYDGYVANARKMLRAKEAGAVTPKMETVQTAEPVVDLMAALQASLSQAPAKKQGRTKAAKKAA